MHPPSSALWRLTKLHLHWEHRGNVFKIAPATMVQQRSKTLKDVTKFLSPAIAGWYLLQLRDRLMLSIDIVGIGYGLYLQQYKGKHSQMELLPFKAGFSWEQFGVFHICRQLSRPLAVLCEQLQRSPGCSWQHRRGTSPRPKSQHNFFDWLFQCSQIDQCFYRIRV